MAGKNYLPVPKDAFKVVGQSLTPQPSPSTSPASSRRVLRTPSSCTSDNESEESAEYDLLAGVRDLNVRLKQQIDIIRQQIKDNEENYLAEKARLMEIRDSEIRNKETEIDNLKESNAQKDDAIQYLKKAGAEKENEIRLKCLEVEDLKKMIGEIQNGVQKIRRQVRRAQKQREKGKQDEDNVEKEKIDEINCLKEEMQELQSRLAIMQMELDNALKVIEKQNSKLETLDKDKLRLQAQFKEELEKLSTSMNKEVERMREVMRQNIEEMVAIRKQNAAMHKDVIDIKKALVEYTAMGGKNEARNDQAFINNEPQSPTNSEPLQLLLPGQRHNTEFNVPRHNPRNRNPRDIRLPAITNTHIPSHAVFRNRFHTSPNRHGPPPPVRENSQFFPKSGGLRFTSSSTFISNDAAVVKSTNAISHKTSGIVYKSIPNGQRPKTDPAFLSVQILDSPYTNNHEIIPQIGSRDGQLPSHRKQSFGRGDKPATTKNGIILMK